MSGTVELLNSLTGLFVGRDMKIHFSIFRYKYLVSILLTFLANHGVSARATVLGFFC